jgi:8-oxo-dGTP pyrophosphatase MutT (NUDIX family)
MGAHASSAHPIVSGTVAYDGRMPDLVTLMDALDADPDHEPEPGDRAAAVLALLLEEPEPAVLFTRRAASTSRHAGEVAFPGGLRDPADATLAATALREVHEELGIDPAAPRLLGALPPIHTFVSAILVTPFVGIMTSLPPLTLSEAEIERAFTVPVCALAAAEERRVLHREGDRAFHGWWYEVEEGTVWGATAFMVHDLLDVMRQVTPWALR